MAGEYKPLYRKRLQRALGGAGGAFLIAPQGYGKSAAVSASLARAGGAVARLALTQMDNVPGRLLQRLQRALVQCGVLAALEQGGVTLAQLERALRGVRGEAGLSLVLEDVHVIKEPAALDLLARLVNCRAQGVRYFVTGRSLPSLAISREDLAWLRRDELAFTIQEIAAYAAQLGAPLPAGLAQALHTLTGGWAAAVDVAARGYAATGMIPLSSLERLAAEGIDALPAHVQRFLLRVSILDGFTKEQGQQLAKCAVTADQLQRLARDAPLLRQEGARGVYHIHNLPLRMLRQRFAALPEGERRTLYARAGQGLWARGQGPRALRCLAMARDGGTALSALRASGVSIHTLGMEEEAVGALAQTAPLYRQANPEGWLMACAIASVSGTGALADCRPILEGLPQARREPLLAEWALARILFSSCPLNEMEACAKRLNRPSRLFAGALGMRTGVFSLAYCRESGRFEQDVHRFSQIMDRAAQLTAGCCAGSAQAAQAALALEKGEAETALSWAGRALAAAQAQGQTAVALGAQYLTARALWLKGEDFQAQLEAMDQLAAPGGPLSGHRHLYRRLLLGQAEADAPWLRKRPAYCAPLEAELLARLSMWLAQGWTLPLRAACRDWLRPGAPSSPLLRIYLYTSLSVSYAQEAPRRARAALLRALDQAQADGVLLPFAWGGPALLQPLQACGHPYAAQALRLLAHTAQGRRSVLTQREHKVLEGLLRGETNAQIARRLYLAEVTVGKALTLLYRKLGVSGRTGAVQRALQLGLVRPAQSAKEV